MSDQKRYYTKDHEWVTVAEDGTAIIGITDFAQSELGEIVFVEVDTVDEELSKEDVFGTVEAVKTTSELFMPVDGTVIEFNPTLSEDDGDNPAMVNEDPYGEGWIVKVKLADPAQLDELMDEAAYTELTTG